MIFSGPAVMERFWDIFFPNRCLSCAETLQYSKKEIFCPVCHQELVMSDTHLAIDHPLKKRLNVEFPFRLVFAKYRFPNKSHQISNLIYGLKYQNLRYIGWLEGEDYGTTLAPVLEEYDITGLVPTPLHWRKEIKRGYNQSLEFAKGVSRTTQIPVLSSILRRIKSTRSQTMLNKKDRLMNMKNAFRARQVPVVLEQDRPAHFLLIDDVVTSGITLAEMARTLQHAYPQCLCSICTLAYKDY